MHFDMTRRVVACLLVLVTSLSLQTAHAHAQFESSSPASGAALENSPREIVLNFTQAVKPVSVSLVGSGGIHVGPVGEVTADGDSIVLAIVEPLPPGAYRVSYRVLSGDSHTISGDFGFAITAPATAEPDPEPKAYTEVEVSPSIAEKPLLSASNFERTARPIFIGLLLMAVGLTIFRFAIALPDMLDAWIVTVLRRIAVVGLLAAFGYFVIATLAMSGPDAFRAQHLYVVLRSSLGLSLLLALAGFLLLAVPVGAQRAWGGMGIALLLTSRVVTGHPASQEPMFVLVPGMAVHVAAVGFWFASLWVLLRLLSKGPLAEAPKILTDFARTAVWSVGALLTAGIVMAGIHLKSLDALLNTEYGILLIGKLVGVAGLLLFAVVNKKVLTPRLAKNFEPTALKLSIRLEAVVMLVIIVLSTVLAATSPISRPNTSHIGVSRAEVSKVVSSLSRTNVIIDGGERVEQ